jgi:predicted nucleic acid-binding protein
LLGGAERVVTSALTSAECTRALARVRALGRISAAEELAALRLLDAAEAAWDLHDLSEPVLAGPKRKFPSEPVRTLDAMHLATGMQVSAVVGQIRILTLDERMRGNAVQLGFETVPDR